MFYVYILLCSDHTYYAGHTADLEKRLSEHASSVMPNSYTSTRKPFRLVYIATFSERDQAKEAEYQIKRWTRKKKEALIAENWEALAMYAKKEF